MDITEAYIIAYPKETIKKLEKMVDNNNSTAMGLLGVLYIKGLKDNSTFNEKYIIEANLKKGINLCKDGSKNDITGYSQLCYAAALIEGKGVKQNYKKALEIYVDFKYNRYIVSEYNIRENINKIIEALKIVRLDPSKENINYTLEALSDINPLKIKNYDSFKGMQMPIISNLMTPKINYNELYIKRNELQKVINKGLSQKIFSEIDKLDTPEKDIFKAYIIFKENKTKNSKAEAFHLLSSLSNKAYKNRYKTFFENLNTLTSQYGYYIEEKEIKNLIQEEKSIQILKSWKNNAEKNSLDALLREMVYIIRLNEQDYTTHSSPLLLPCDILKENKDSVISAFYTPSILKYLHSRPIFDCPMENMMQIPEYYKLLKTARTWNMPYLDINYINDFKKTICWHNGSF